MTDSSASIPPFPALPAAGALCVLTAGGVTAAAAVLTWLNQSGQFAPALLTAAVCLSGALAGLIPVWRASRLSVDRTVMAFVASMLGRLLTTLLGAVVLIYAVGLSVRSVAGWSGLWYLLLLGAEMSLLARYFGALSAASAPEGGESEEEFCANGEVHPCSH